MLKNVEELNIDVGFNEMKEYGSIEVTKSIVGLNTVKKLSLSFN